MSTGRGSFIFWGAHQARIKACEVPFDAGPHDFTGASGMKPSATATKLFINVSATARGASVG